MTSERIKPTSKAVVIVTVALLSAACAGSAPHRVGAGVLGPADAPSGGAVSIPVTTGGSMGTAKDAPVRSPGDYASLAGVEGLEVAYDFRLADPKMAALFLKLIHATYRDQTINGLTVPPRFVVVFSGAAVKLIAEGRPDVSPEDQTHLAEIAHRIGLMAEDGIRLEGCRKAAELFGIDPELFHTDIQKIDNAWISLAGYQAQNYSALPIN